MNSLVPFIPRAIDEAGLSPIEFRILMHLWRRAGKRARCWPGAEIIRTTCGISDDSLWKAIGVLEVRGFLRREKRRYNSNEYVLMLPDVTPENRVTVSPTKTGEPLPVETGDQSPHFSGEPLPGIVGYKGMKGKVPQEGKQKKGGAARPSPGALISFPWRTVADLPEDLRTTLAGTYPDADDQADVLNTICGRELTFKGQHRLDDWRFVFIAAVDKEDKADRSNKEGRALFAEGGQRRRRNAGPQDETRKQLLGEWHGGTVRLGVNIVGATNGPPPGPQGWQQFVDTHMPGAHATGGVCHGPWHLKDSTVRGRIEQEMKAHRARSGAPDEDVPWDVGNAQGAA